MIGDSSTGDQVVLYSIGYPSWRTFSIPKRNGKVRVIRDPGRKHRLACRSITPLVYQKAATALQHIPEFGFIPGLGFQHAIQKVALDLERVGKRGSLIMVDLSDFFPTISERRARRTCARIWGSKALAKVACLNGKLAQGHPFAPAIANACAIPMKQALHALATKLGGHATFYADDINIALPPGVDPKDAMVRIKRIIKGQGFKINDQKVRIRRIASLAKTPLRILGGSIHAGAGTGRPLGLDIRMSRAQRRRARALLYIATSHEPAPTIYHQLYGLGRLAADLAHITASHNRSYGYHGKFVAKTDLLSVG